MLKEMSLLTDTLLTLHAPLTLPSQKFFEPGGVFPAWMVTQFDGKHIYDVGAGVGHVARVLAERGFKVTAIDSAGRESYEYPVMRVNGLSCGYQKGSVVMLCRPCHGFFPECVVEQALKCKAGAVVYVGKTENVNGDLGRFRKKFRVELTNAGKDGERVYVMRTPFLEKQ